MSGPDRPGTGPLNEGPAFPAMKSPGPIDPGAPLDPLPGHSSRGRLERVLRAGEFAVTAELSPPDSADPMDVFERAAIFDGWVDAINATDGSGANCHMSSLGVCALLTRVGYAPVMQISARDRNRIAIQGDVLSAAAMGVSNILCLTGDGVQCGDHPQAQPVFDLDCMTTLAVLSTMRDEGTFASGRRLDRAPELFLGAAANPFAPPFDYRPLRLQRKIEAGAQFVQTQYCSTSPASSATWNACATWGFTRDASSWWGSGPWPRPGRRGGSAPMSPESIFPTPSSTGWRVRRTPGRKESGSVLNSSSAYAISKAFPGYT